VKSLRNNYFLHSLLIVGMFCGPLTAQYPHYNTPPAVVHNNPYNPGYHYNSPVVLVPLVQKVYALPDAFFSSRTTYSEEQRDELIKMMRQLVNMMERQQGGVPTAAIQNPTTYGGPGAPATNKGAKASGKIAEALQSCIQCHSPAGGNKGGFDLSNPDNVTAEGRVASLRSVLKGTMPKGGGKVSPEHEATFEKWAAGVAQ
jgi:mono/diheme cytochrome c family protein